MLVRREISCDHLSTVSMAGSFLKERSESLSMAMLSGVSNYSSRSGAIFLSWFPSIVRIDQCNRSRARSHSAIDLSRR